MTIETKNKIAIIIATIIYTTIISLFNPQTIVAMLFQFKKLNIQVMCILFTKIVYDIFINTKKEYLWYISNEY